jgi:hypothetical protein
LLTKTGVNALESAPFLVIVGMIILTSIMVWALRGQTAAKPPRLRFAMDIGAAHGTAVLVALVLTLSLLQVGVGMPLNPVNYIAYAPGIAAWSFGFCVGTGIGYFIWLGRYEAMFGVANLLIMLAITFYASTPETALNWLISLGILQFAAGVYLAKFQARS